MNLREVLVVSLAGLTFVNGQELAPEAVTNLTSEIELSIVQDFEKYFDTIFKQHELSFQDKQKIAGFVLESSLLKLQNKLKGIEKEENFTTEELQSYLKKTLSTSPKIDELQRKIANLISSDQTKLSPRFFLSAYRQVKSWFITKAIQVVGSFMDLPELPKDEDFEDDAYFNTLPKSSE